MSGRAAGTPSRLVVTAWAVIAALLALWLRGRATDDVFITYRYVANLLAGQGLVFNPGERAFAISDPGVALAIAAVAGLGRIAPPLAGTLVTAAAQLALAACLLAAAGARQRTLEGALAGTLVLTAPLLWQGQGAGPLVALAVLAVAERLAAARRPLLAGVVAGAAVWCRPDAGLGAAILLLAGWRDRGRPLRFLLGLAPVVAAGLALAWGYYGTPLPSTAAAKRAFAALAGGELTGAAFWARALEVFAQSEGPAAWPLLVLALPGTVLLWRGGGALGRLLLLYGLASAAFYTVLGVSFFVWYVVPPVVALLAAAGFALGWLVRRGRALAARSPAPRAAAAALLLVAVALAGLHLLRRGQWLEQTHRNDWRRAAYRTAGEWLAAHAAPADAVALTEVGIVGYHGGLRVLDLIGLVSPGAAPFAEVGDPLGAFLAEPPRYVLFHTFRHRAGTRPILARPWFPRCYELAAALPVAGHGGEVRIYASRTASPRHCADLPPPRPPQPRQPRRPAR